MRLLAIALAAVLVVLQWRLWFGDGSVAEVMRLEEAVAEQREHNASLRERNEALAADVRDLKNGLAAVEERARRELGMIGRGEMFYQVIEPRD